jgi:hypothetical protein
LDIIERLGVMSRTWTVRGGKNAVPRRGLVSSSYPDKKRYLFERKPVG